MWTGAALVDDDRVYGDDEAGKHKEGEDCEGDTGGEGVGWWMLVLVVRAVCGGAVFCVPDSSLADFDVFHLSGELAARSDIAYKLCPC